jgi:hypothetical protein
LAEGASDATLPATKRRRRNDDSDKLLNLVSAGVESMDVKRASVCTVLAVAKVKVPSSNGVAQ